MELRTDQRRPRSHGLKHTILALALALPFGVSVALADNAIDLNIGPQPLESALRAFIEQSHVDLLYSPERVRGLHTDGVTGVHEPADALHLLLTGTGIGVERSDDAYLLVNAETISHRGEMSPTITVTATRTERDVLDVPASVSVVTAKEIEQQHASKPEDLLRSLPGVDIAYKDGVAVPNVPILRGSGLSSAGSTTQFLLNGMPVEPIAEPVRNYWYSINLDNVERIEVVRGPSSVLYGPSAMGGVINVITKRGAGEPHAFARVGGGSHNAHELTVGAGGSFGDFDLQLNARTYETDGFNQLPETPAPYASFPFSFTDLDSRGGKESKYGARLTWWLGVDTDLSFGIQHYDNEGDWLGGHPNYRAENEGNTYDIAYNTRFAGGQELKVKLLSTNSSWWQTYDMYYFTGSLDETKRSHESRKSRSADVQLDLHPVEGNTLTLGTTYSDGDIVWDNYSPGGAALTSSNSHKSRQYGALIQDEHRFDRLTVTAGVRYDKYEFYDDLRSGTAYPDSDDTVATPRLGLSYKLREGLALYGSAGTAYIPAPNSLKYRSGGIWLDNPDLKPETAVSYETGVKFASPNNGVDGSVAVYQSTYKDRITSAMVGSQMQYQNIGEIQTSGVELELKGRLAKFWQPFFNYTYTDAEITENPSNTAWEGNTPANVAKHKANVGLTYDNPSLFTAYVVGRYVGDRYFMDSNADNTKAASHFITDMKLSKSFSTGSGPDLIASLAVNNVFDRDGYGFFYEKLDGRNYWLELEAKF
ncbi:MAG: TonB-dependent receptor [Thiohalomonadaceae bacterium]